MGTTAAAAAAITTAVSGTAPPLKVRPVASRVTVTDPAESLRTRRRTFPPTGHLSPPAVAAANVRVVPVGALVGWSARVAMGASVGAAMAPVPVSRGLELVYSGRDRRERVRVQRDRLVRRHALVHVVRFVPLEHQGHATAG